MGAGAGLRGECAPGAGLFPSPCSPQLCLGGGGREGASGARLPVKRGSPEEKVGSHVISRALMRERGGLPDILLLSPCCSCRFMIPG